MADNINRCKTGAGGHDQQNDKYGRYSGPVCDCRQLPMRPPPSGKLPPHWLPTPEITKFIEARRDHLEPINRGKWDEFAKAIDKLPGATETEKFAYMMIFGVEGMMKVDDDGTSSGIKPSTLNDYIDSGKFVLGKDRIIKGPVDLTIEERAEFYRVHFDENLLGGHNALNKLGDKETAAAVADVVFQFSPSGAKTIFTMALEELNVKTTKEHSKPSKDEIWDKLVAKTKNPHDRLELRKSIAKAREKKAGGKKKRGDKYFGIDRYTHFVHYCY